VPYRITRCDGAYSREKPKKHIVSTLYSYLLLNNLYNSSDDVPGRRLQDDPSYLVRVLRRLRFIESPETGEYLRVPYAICIYIYTIFLTCRARACLNFFFIRHTYKEFFTAHLTIRIIRILGTAVRTSRIKAIVVVPYALIETTILIWRSYRTRLPSSAGGLIEKIILTSLADDFGGQCARGRGEKYICVCTTL